MIVDRETLSVLPITDKVIHSVVGAYESEIERGPVAWSNELVLHVLEMKTNGPAPELESLPEKFHASLAEADERAGRFGGRLLPTAMHPWMDPAKEMVLWPHEYNPVYETYDRIFDCRGHGWSNLQSMHINLPFGSDREFGDLHAAIRYLLPLLPGLAASSPIMEGKPTGILDNRLAVYRTNQRAVPSMTGRVVPEPVWTEKDYREKIHQRIFKDLEPHDPEGVLRYEFANSRGAIARFDRGAIEIRVLDLQETPFADLAIAALIVEALKALVAGRWVPLETVKAHDTEALGKIFDAAVPAGERAPVEDPAYLAGFGMKGRKATVGDVWAHLRDALLPAGKGPGKPWTEALDVILGKGPLARRILAATGKRPSPKKLHDVYRALAECLMKGELFDG